MLQFKKVIFYEVEYLIKERRLIDESINFINSGSYTCHGKLGGNKLPD